LCQRPFIKVGIDIRCVERRILRQTGDAAPHRMKLSWIPNDDSKDVEEEKMERS
jgi:hypothetical protein